jgi:hypothetical protein
MRLGDIQRHIGLALGGEPGSRLADRLAMPVSGDTLLRLIRASALEPPAPPRIIGIDEWAWRRGLTYGTILCDLERGHIIDLLPDRKADTVAAWLRRHPGVSVIARDRAGVYTDGIRQGTPTRRRLPTAGTSCAISETPCVPPSIATAPRSALLRTLSRRPLSRHTQISRGRTRRNSTRCGASAACSAGNAMSKSIAYARRVCRRS